MRAEEVLVLLLLFFHGVTAISEAHKVVFDVLNNPEYNKETRPNPTAGENATVVRINLSIRKITNVDDIKMSFTTQLTIRQKWTDDRLKYGERNDSEYITLNDVVADKLWTPDLFFDNEAESFVHKVMKPNSYKRVYPSGRVMWSTRLTITFSCPMDLHFFPFDSQICQMTISPFSETSRAVKISWDDKDPVILVEGRQYSRFNLLKLETGYCNSVVNGMADEFSCLLVILHLKRQTGFYISQIYCPIFMYVLMSWVAFWLGPLISARLTLTVTLLLTSATQVQGTNQNLPQVSYMRALDVWTATCLSFSCLAIFETATVAFLMQSETSLVGCFDMKNSKKKATNPLCTKLDCASKIIFPLGFSVFVLVYVFTYVISDNPVDPSGFVKN